MTLACDEAEVLAAAQSVGSLDGDDVEALRGHLATCAACRAVAAEYAEAAARLPLALAPVQPPEELRRRLMRDVYSSAERRSAPSRRGIPQRWAARLWSLVPSHRLITVAAVAAAVALAVLGARAAIGPANPAGAQSVALVATATSSGAHGQLVYTPAARQGVLTVEGLTPPRVGNAAGVYEVWLIRRDGSASAAAFLTQSPDGDWTAAVHGDMSAFISVAATVEPSGGSLVPTGAKVVVGSLADMTPQTAIPG